MGEGPWFLAVHAPTTWVALNLFCGGCRGRSLVGFGLAALMAAQAMRLAGSGFGQDGRWPRILPCAVPGFGHGGLRRRGVPLWRTHPRDWFLGQ